MGLSLPQFYSSKSLFSSRNPGYPKWLENYKVKATIYLILRSRWNLLSRPHPSLARAKCTCWVSTLLLGGASGGTGRPPGQCCGGFLQKQSSQESPSSGVDVSKAPSFSHPLLLPTCSAHYCGALWRHFDPSFTSQTVLLKTCSDQDCTPTCNQHYLFTYVQEDGSIHQVCISGWYCYEWFLFFKLSFPVLLLGWTIWKFPRFAGQTDWILVSFKWLGLT